MSGFNQFHKNRRKKRVGGYILVKFVGNLGLAGDVRNILMAVEIHVIFYYMTTDAGEVTLAESNGIQWSNLFEYQNCGCDNVILTLTKTININIFINPLNIEF